MGYRDIVLRAAYRAAEVIDDTGAMERIEQDGYTRIDPFQIAADSGVIVMLRPMQKLLGAFLGDATPGILVNMDRPAGLVHMTCAHELGHFFMGHGSAADENIYYGSKGAIIEQEADQFGYNLLAPRKLIVKIMQRKQWTKAQLFRPEILYQLALRMGVSYEAAAWSLRRHNVMSTDQVQQILLTTPAMIKRSLLGNRLIDARKDVWLLDNDDRTSILEPRPTDQLVMRLPSRASSGFLWEADSADALASEGFQLEPLTVRSEPADDSFVFGGPDTMDYVLTGGHRRNSTPLNVQLSERAPWDSSSPATDSFKTIVQFESLDLGLTPQSRRQLLDGGQS
ncbi:ImmA/IrrE family metallo-endopeptidase [Pseudomonas oryzihabitans]|uniref:ImmA/IrrE family metallo-endopeptidase n=1 Tax=Pseudomonas oryzihabitans TaxID=47885 RepID=UPI002855C264|nr:ImmA/IrrE family metallo-endopeptidase [Pseudomonas psychrotolerans]MDR6680162.1 Zn-dependent peptidase ImmA (M78 family) [Pseudomonas psychrotolerans]